jgi:hypothetical protein
LVREAEEQQRRRVELAEVEQEQNRMRIERFRGEIERRLAEKKEMCEGARQEDFMRLRAEEDGQQERQRKLNEERRKLFASRDSALRLFRALYGSIKAHFLRLITAEVRTRR